MSSGTDHEQNSSRLLEGCLLQACASNTWLERRVLPLSVDQLRWTPRSDRWSIAANLDHMNRTLSYYLPRLEQALREDRRAINREKWESPESEELLVGQMEPPVEQPMRAPSAVLPGLALDVDRIAEQFPLLRNEFARIVQSISAVDLGLSIPGTLHPPVQSLGAVVCLLAAHERRHLWQVQQILCASGFLASFTKPHRDITGH